MAYKMKGNKPNIQNNNNKQQFKRRTTPYNWQTHTHTHLQTQRETQSEISKNLTAYER